MAAEPLPAEGVWLDPPPAVEREISVLCHVQLAPPKGLAEEFAALLRDIGADSKLSATVLLGFWGYPDFPGLSEKDPVHAFLLDCDGGTRWLFCVRAGGDSPLVSALSLQGLRAVSSNDWLFLCRDGEVLANSDLRAALASLVQLPLGSDLRLECHPALIRRATDYCERLTLENLQRLGDMNANMQALSLFNFILNFSDDLERLVLSLDLREKSLACRTTFRAIPGSDLAILFNEPVDALDTEPIAQFLPADGIAHGLVRYGPRRISRLLELFLDGFFSYGQQGLEGIAEREVYNQVHNFFSALDGVAGMALCQDGSRRKLLGGNISPAQLAESVDFFYTKVAPILLTSLTALPPDAELRVETEVDRNAFVHQGIPAIRAWVEETRSLPGCAEERHSAVTYFCSLENRIAIADGEAALREMIDAARRGNLEKPSLADAGAMDFENGVAANWRVFFPDLTAGCRGTLRLGEDQLAVEFCLDNPVLRAAVRAAGSAVHP